FLPAPSTTHIYPLSLHDALPISSSTPKRYRYSRRIHSLQKVDDLGRPSRIRRLLISPHQQLSSIALCAQPVRHIQKPQSCSSARSEEHTSELQSLAYLVCRLLLE